MVVVTQLRRDRRLENLANETHVDVDLDSEGRAAHHRKAAKLRGNHARRKMAGTRG